MENKEKVIQEAQDKIAKMFPNVANYGLTSTDNAVDNSATEQKGKPASKRVAELERRVEFIAGQYENHLGIYHLPGLLANGPPYIPEGEGSINEKFVHDESGNVIASVGDKAEIKEDLSNIIQSLAEGALDAQRACGDDCVCDVCKADRLKELKEYTQNIKIENQKEETSVKIPSFIHKQLLDDHAVADRLRSELVNGDWDERGRYIHDLLTGILNGDEK